MRSKRQRVILRFLPVFIMIFVCSSFFATEASAEPFIGEIAMFAGNFAPRGWALCDGQLLDIATNTALFSLLGTTYGGDGRTTFGIPDLRGRAPIHAGTGPGLTPRALGAQGGAETHTLIEDEIPPHSHTLNVYQLEGDSVIGTNNVLAKSADGEPDYSSEAPTNEMNTASIGDSLSGNAHNNMPPFTAINYIIALTGVYPSR